MPIKYIILNGPPESGKSTIAKELCHYLSAVQSTPVVQAIVISQDSMAAPMKHFIATALGESYSQINKERARPELNGFSVREFLIDLSENYIKPKYGEDVFGRWLVHRSLRNAKKLSDYIIIDDGGFWPELNALPNKLIVRVERPGKSFRGDSRSYVDPVFHTLRNEGGLIDLYQEIERLALKIKHASTSNAA